MVISFTFTWSWLSGHVLDGNSPSDVDLLWQLFMWSMMSDLHKVCFPFVCYLIKLISCLMSPRMNNLAWSCDAVSSRCLASQGGLCFDYPCWPSFIFPLATCPCLAVLTITVCVGLFQLWSNITCMYWLFSISYVSSTKVISFGSSLTCSYPGIAASDSCLPFCNNWGLVLHRYLYLSQ